MGHARNRKGQKVFPYPCTWRCRIAPFRCVWNRTVKERVSLPNPPSDKLLWQTPCQSNWLLCTPQQIKRTWLWNLKIKTKAPSSAVCKSTDSADADCVLNNCNYIPELAGGAKASPREVIKNSIFIQTQPGHWQTTVSPVLSSDEVKKWPPGEKKTKLSAVVTYKHADIQAVYDESSVLI